MSGGCDGRAVGYLAGTVPAGAPLNFTAMGQSSTSVRLQWEPPATRHRNGEIVMYELLYHDRRDPTDDWPTNTTETSLVVDGLQPTTNYIFQIRAYTGKGPGPWSNQLPFQTFAAQRTSPPRSASARYCATVLLRRLKMTDRRKMADWKTTDKVSAAICVIFQSP